MQHSQAEPRLRGSHPDRTVGRGHDALQDVDRLAVTRFADPGWQPGTRLTVFPTHERVVGHRPEISFRVLRELPCIQDGHAIGRGVTDRPLALHFTQRTLVILEARAREPDAAVAFNDGQDPAWRIGVVSQLAVEVAVQPHASADPETAVTARPQGEDAVRAQLLPRGWNEGHEAHTVETHQAAARTDPDVAIGGLRDIHRRA